MFSGFLLFYSGYITPISGRAKIINSLRIHIIYGRKSTDSQAGS